MEGRIREIRSLKREYMYKLKTLCKSIEKKIKKLDAMILIDPNDNLSREKRQDLIYECQEIGLDIYGLKGELDILRERLARCED
jgi:hypothetical protein